METLNQNAEPTWSASKRKKFTVTLAGVFFIFIAVFFIGLDMFMQTEAQAADKINGKDLNSNQEQAAK